MPRTLFLLAAFAAASLAVSGSATAAPAAMAPEPPQLARVQQAISEQVQLLLKCRRPDGSFALGTSESAHMVGMYNDYKMGQTALAVLALQYARPHLKGELQTRAYEACRDGIGYIVQRPPEPRTYSAGLILTVLFNENPEHWRRVIDAYAAMLILSQHDNADKSGLWGYRLQMPPGWEGPRVAPDSWGDKSNTQFALLGLYNARRAGVQVPRAIWERSAEHYVKAQFPDGGWGYQPSLRPKPYVNMTLASTISLELCLEMILSEGHKQCKAPPRFLPVEAGLKWLTTNWEKGGLGNPKHGGPVGWRRETGEGGVVLDAYGLYALERLGILRGRSNLGEHDWYAEGAARILEGENRSMFGTPEVTLCFTIAFLSRGLDPIIVNKLERRGTADWNNDPYDVKHLVEFIEDRYQQPAQWRIVTLEAPLEMLLKTPILYVSGHAAMSFSDAEKKKLKDYIDGGGTLLAQACCASKPFDKSLRALVAELTRKAFRGFPAGHRIYERMQVAGVTPNIEVLYAPAEREQSRPAVIYIPTDACCRWHAGGPAARESYAVGAGIWFYVSVECRQMFLEAYPDAPPEAPAIDPLRERKGETGPLPEPPRARPDAPADTGLITPN